jgi:hypothetical protein
MCFILLIHQILLKRLSDDLKYDHDAMMSVVSYQAIVRQYAMSAVDALKGANSVNDEQFVISAYQASQINTLGVTVPPTMKC